MAAIAVVVAVGSPPLTLLPAALAILGPHGSNSLRVRRPATARPMPAAGTAGPAWASRHRPPARSIAGLAALAILDPADDPAALPRPWASRTSRRSRARTTARRAYDLHHRDLRRRGSTGRSIVAVTLGSPASGPTDPRPARPSRRMSHRVPGSRRPHRFSWTRQERRPTSTWSRHTDRLRHHHH